MHIASRVYICQQQQQVLLAHRKCDLRSPLGKHGGATPPAREMLRLPAQKRRGHASASKVEGLVESERRGGRGEKETDAILVCFYRSPGFRLDACAFDVVQEDKKKKMYAPYGGVRYRCAVAMSCRGAVWRCPAAVP